MEVFFKGLWIGGTMTVPGVSGGTMAILLGIYDRLIGAVSGLIPKKGAKGGPGAAGDAEAAGGKAYDTGKESCGMDWKEYRRTALHSLLFLSVFYSV